MNHNNKTLCEKIAEGFVISFLIALLVVPCDLFQPTMWAAAVPPSTQSYIFEYPCAEPYEARENSGAPSNSQSDRPAQPLSPLEPQPAKSNPTENPNTPENTPKTDNTPVVATNNTSVAGSENEADFKKEAGTNSQTHSESETNAEPKNVSESDTETKAGSGTDTKTKGGTDTKTESVSQDPIENLPEEFPVNADEVKPGSAIQESEIFASGDSLKVIPVDTIAIVQSPEAKFAMDSLRIVTNDSISEAFIAEYLSVKEPKKEFNVWVPREYDFNPDPTRAVWLSALFPGLGQIYNRRYWKLPIVVGAYMGLAYATSWNDTMLGDYTRAYRDIMDNDPSTNSYMDFFPPTVDESTLDKTWLKNILYSRKNYFRRYRDLCIILMVGVYLLAMVDAYVDASLAHFDISQDLSLDWSPAVFHDGYAKWPSLGVSWAFNF